MTFAVTMMRLAALVVLPLAIAVPLQQHSSGTTQCNGVNCWISLTGEQTASAHSWTPEQRALAKPAELLKIEVDSLPHLDTTPFAFNCTDPVRLDASSCKTPPCYAMGKSYFFSPAIHDFGTCSGALAPEFITDGRL